MTNLKDESFTILNQAIAVVQKALFKVKNLELRCSEVHLTRTLELRCSEVHLMHEVQ